MLTGIGPVKGGAMYIIFANHRMGGYPMMMRVRDRGSWDVRQYKLAMKGTIFTEIFCTRDLHEAHARRDKEQREWRLMRYGTPGVG